MESASPPSGTRPTPESPLSAQGRGEVLIDGHAVLVTFHLPEFGPNDLDFRVGTRTVSLWSKRPEAGFRTIVVLPSWVEPGRFVMTHKNGVYEFHMRAHDGNVLPVAA